MLGWTPLIEADDVRFDNAEYPSNYAARLQMHDAAAGGNMEGVLAALAAGAGARDFLYVLREDGVGEGDGASAGPLHEVIRHHVYGDPESAQARTACARVLLDAGAMSRVDGTGDDVDDAPLLHMAAASDLPKVCDLLLNAGADVDGRFDGCTPLHVACLMDHATCIKLLLSRGADMNAVVHQNSKNVPLLSPLALAIQTPHDFGLRPHQNRGAIATLLGAGATVPSNYVAQLQTVQGLAQRGNYLRRVEQAGGFRNHERAHRASLVAMLQPKFADRLPIDSGAVPRIIAFWAHVGYY